MSQSPSLIEIHARLRAADRALALVQGGSSELAHVREATGSLLVALHELVDLWEKHELYPGGLSVELPGASERPARRASQGGRDVAGSSNPPSSVGARRGLHHSGT